MKIRLASFFVFAVFSLVGCGILGAKEDEDPVAGVFRSAYDEWKQYLREDASHRSSIFSSDMPSSIFYDNDPFRKIVALGVPAIPHISDRLPEDPLLFKALQEITKWNYRFVRDGNSPKDYIWTLDGFPEIRLKRLPSSIDVWNFWWESGRFKTEDRFGVLYKNWFFLKEGKRDVDAAEIYQKILDLGIPVLSYLIEIVGRNPEFVQAISVLSSGGVPPTATASECKKWWDDNKYKFELPPRKALGKVDKHE